MRKIQETIGATVRLDAPPYVLIGVLPAGFHSNGRLVRQLLGESLLLGLLRGAAGVAVSWSCIRLLPYIQHERLPGLLEKTRMDGTVLAFTLAISILTGLIFGAAPAFAILRGNVY